MGLAGNSAAESVMSHLRAVTLNPQQAVCVSLQVPRPATEAASRHTCPLSGGQTGGPVPDENGGL